MKEIKLFYNIVNGGDGSASVEFHLTREACQLACDIQDEEGEAFCENYPETLTLKFNDAGELINPGESMEELRERMYEASGNPDFKPKP